ncbi:hypothetical protein, partial [Enterobacter hormaechei]|uniref:hypothetical protein n=3 Tax=Enterobacter TaxID=547 RepID=UPI0006666DD1
QRGYEASIDGLGEGRGMSMMDFAETKKAIDAITTDWSIRGPYHEDDGKYYALLRGEWVGGGHVGKRKTLDAIFEKLTSEVAQ